MRPVILVLSLALVGGGCASNQLRSEYRSVAASLGVDQEEVAAVARQASERFKLFVIGVKKSEDGAIVVSLCHIRTPPRSRPFPSWVEVTFRKIDGRWQEDPKSQRDFIV
ncbi:MAG TPA: hypothetical protein PLN52_18040 [Opitutaceae bacterium]|nr:hypothetical protein [Opitutaceae bacterium]